MSKDTRPFNFTINAAEFFAEIETKSNKKDLLNWIEQFAKDLITLLPKTDYGKKVVQQTIDYIEKQSANGAKGGRPPKSQTKAVVNSGLSQTKAKQKPSETNKNNNKNKEEVKEEIIIPTWIPLNTWNDFVKHRELKKDPMTELAKKMMFKRLDAHRAVYDVDKLLSKAISRGWLDIYPDDSCKIQDEERVFF